MSWFNQASLSSFAKTALSSAQKSIDKVLDIQDEEGSDTGSGSQTAQSSGGTGRASSLSNPGSASAGSLSGKLQSNSEEDGPSGQEGTYANYLMHCNNATLIVPLQHRIDYHVDR